jgi:starch phosphorylase
MTTPEVEAQRAAGYYPRGIYQADENIRELLDGISSGEIGGNRFENIVQYLLSSDPYMVLRDFASYKQAQTDMTAAYQDKNRWGSMSLVNIAKAGFFASDRSIRDYARDIWHIDPLK